MAWYKEQRSTLLKNLGANDDGPVDPTNNISPDVGAAMADLVDNMALDREARIAKEQRTETEKKRKAWDKLSHILQRIILRASTTLDGTPDEPADTLHEILESKSGAMTAFTYTTNTRMRTWPSPLGFARH